MNPDTDAVRPRGVIGCLTAGFEMLPRNLQVAALPMALDLVLWLGPRVSIGPLLDGFVRFLTRQAATDAETSEQLQQAVLLLEQFGERFNLLGVLGSTPVLQLPSLLARHAPEASTPVGAARVLSVGSVLALIPWWALLTLVGLVVGFLYLNEIAHQVLQGEGVPTEAPEGNDVGRADNPGAGRGDGARKLARFMVFACGLLAAGMLILPLWLTVVALAGAVAMPLGVLLWIGGVGFFSYVGLHLVFVIPSMLLGGRRLGPAIGESILLSHTSLSPLLGFVLLAVVIYEGLGYAWTLPSSDSWAMVIGIMGNGVVGTGLAAAGFMFYRDRIEVIRRLMAGQADRAR